jgi:hypothetical protein
MMNIFSIVRKIILLAMIAILGSVFSVGISLAQFSSGPEFEGYSKVSTQKNNFVASRKKAIKEAKRAAVENALVNLMGEDEFISNEKKLAGVLSRPDKYVMSYRFVKAIDDPVEMVSEVILMVRLYPEAVGYIMGKIGVESASIGEQRVLVLLRENSFTQPSSKDFWANVPISETSLSQDIISAGIQVVDRENVQDVVSEETIEKALQGDIGSAVNIGMQARVDLVILGNANSSLLQAGIDGREKIIQASISLRVVSVLKAAIVSAKSDFATAEDIDPMKAEMQAFANVSEKLLVFLKPSIERYWEKGTVVQVEPRTTPTHSSPPLQLNDL